MVSFVYFDLGGVVVSDFSGTNKWELMRRDIGITPENDKEFNKFWDKFEKEIHVGRDVDTLIPLIKEKFHLDFPVGFSLLTYFVDRFDSNKPIWPVIDSIRRDRRIGLLTNMYPRMLSAMTEKRIMPSVSWDVIIDSTIEGYQKPDLDIFKLAQLRTGVEKDNVFYIDNSLVNINAAKNFGWKIFLYDSSDHKNSSRKLLDYYESIT